MSIIGQLIERVISLSLSDVLKADGYRKQHHTWRCRTDSCIRVVNVQGSNGNIGSTGKFTINLGIYFPQVAGVSSYGSITKEPKEYECTIRSRIGQLMPTRQDKWWTLNDHTDLQTVSEEVRKVWLAYGKPWITLNSDLDEARNYAVKKGDLMLATEMSVASGELDTAQYWLDEVLRTRPDRTYTDWLQWAVRQGLKI